MLTTHFAIRSMGAAFSNQPMGVSANHIRDVVQLYPKGFVMIAQSAFYDSDSTENTMEAKPKWLGNALKETMSTVLFFGAPILIYIFGQNIDLRQTADDLHLQFQASIDSDQVVEKPTATAEGSFTVFSRSCRFFNGCHDYETFRIRNLSTDNQIRNRYDLIFEICNVSDVTRSGKLKDISFVDASGFSTKWSDVSISDLLPDECETIEKRSNKFPSDRAPSTSSGKWTFFYSDKNNRKTKNVVRLQDGIFL